MTAKKATKAVKSFKPGDLLTLILKRDLLLAIVVALAVIFGGVFLGGENNRVVPVNSDPNARYVSIDPSAHLAFMSNWDGPDYIRIAAHGYSNKEQANFFPLYPILIRALNSVIGSPLYSALALSWLSFTGAIYFYLKVIKQLFNKVSDNQEALRGLLFFVLFPTGVFLLATYTESLFAFLSLAAIYFCLKKNYWPAALALAMATATHINGIFAVVLVALMMLEQKERLSRIAATAAVGVLGIVGYIVYLAHRFNSPLLFIKAQQKHGWLADGLNHSVSTIGWMNIIFIILIIASVFYWWSRRKSFAIYSLLFLSIPVIGGQFGGFNRYVLMDFPLQWMLYLKVQDSKVMYPLALSLSAVLWAYFLFQYAGGYVGG
jgi:Gpi18-like mannosyltransferase